MVRRIVSFVWKVRKLLNVGLGLTLVLGAQADVGRDVAGMAIAGSDDHVYVWYRDGTASSGTSRRLDVYRTPYQFAPAAGQSASSIVGTAIAKSNDWSYVWHSNGQVSAGSTGDHDSRRASYNYQIPGERQPGNIVGMAISIADHVFTWYDDGKYTEGSSDNLGRYGTPVSYTLAPGYGPENVLGMAMTGSNNWVYVWYDDGYMSAGSPNNLDVFIQKRPYSQSLFLKSEWGPSRRINIDIVKPAALANILDTDQKGSQRLSADQPAHRGPMRHTTPEKEAKRKRVIVQPDAADDIGDLERAEIFHETLGQINPDISFSDNFTTIDRDILGKKPIVPLGGPFDTAINSIDPMLAVGQQYIVASQYKQIEFLGKLGSGLPAKAGVGPVVDANDLFAAFLWDMSGQTATDINLHTGFPRSCNDSSYPQTSLSARMCIVEAYDVRAFHNPGSGRFVIIANLRNKVNSDIWFVSPGRYAEAYKEYTGDENDDICGVHKPAGGTKTYTDDRDVCEAVRRHVAIAVSKTADPRDGFHLYAIIPNNYRDFPWATINGDVLLINHHGEEMAHGAVATGVSLSELEAGHFRPSYFQYFREDVAPYVSVRLPQHGAATDGVTLMYGVGNGKTTLFAFPQPSARFLKPPLSPPLDVAVTPRWPAFYQSVYFHMVGHHNVAGYSEANMRRNIEYTRIPISRVYTNGGYTISASTDPAAGFRNRSFGKNSLDDNENEIWSYEEPVIAVNTNNDVVIAYGRMPVFTSDMRFPDVRYTVWYHNENDQRPSIQLISGQALPKVGKNGQRQRPSFVHHAGAVVDPANPTDVWISHVYLKQDGADRFFQQFIARARP